MGLKINVKTDVINIKILILMAQENLSQLNLSDEDILIYC
jgi:hypothetical protein